MARKRSLFGIVQEIEKLTIVVEKGKLAEEKIRSLHKQADLVKEEEIVAERNRALFRAKFLEHYLNTEEKG